MLTYSVNMEHMKNAIIIILQKKDFLYWFDASFAYEN